MKGPLLVSGHRPCYTSEEERHHYTVLHRPAKHKRGGPFSLVRRQEPRKMDSALRQGNPADKLCPCFDLRAWEPLGPRPHSS